VVGADGRIEKRNGGVVARQLPHISDNGNGVNRPQAREPGVEDACHEYHPMTMPELRRWFAFLSARLRHVRILNGDWARACTGGALKSLSVRKGGHCGVFLDPPYGDVRVHDLYAEDSLGLAAAVRAWCIEQGSASWLRVVLAGFAGEHEELAAHGWRAVEWYRKGFLKGGMSNTGKGDGQQQLERLWLSPHCLGGGDREQLGFGFGGDE
jgi:hypothetical protein